MGIFDGLLLLSDMDGTLLTMEKELTEENARAAEYFIANGGKFSVATGRAKRAMEYFLPRLKINAPAVLFNGSIIYDFERDAATCQMPIEFEQANAFARDIMARFPWAGFEIYLADSEFVAQNSDMTRRHFKAIQLEIIERRLEEIATPWIKFNITGNAEDMVAVEKYCIDTYGGKYFMQFSSTRFFEIMANGADKGSGAIKVCEHCGIAREKLFAIGDSFNDLELLKCAAFSFAPKNAIAQIREIADCVLTDNNNHVLAAAVDYIEKMVGK